MDAFDRASEIEAKLTDIALANHFAKQTPVSSVSASECLECGDVIPAARQAAVQGCQYCITCQTLADKGKL
ncbi:MAG: phage/conjugal plasmid C-4 type zinc finger TraR family protein [Moritella dasanensis]|jgi:phage/conjugal plasmid C-4 type zinc finger TraR family protein